VRRQGHRFLGGGFVDASHFKHDASRFHDGDPLFRSAFAFAHAGFRGLLGERLVREDANPQFSAALDEAGNGHARSFNLATVIQAHSSAFKPYSPKARSLPRQLCRCGGHAFAFGISPFGHQHRYGLASLNSLLRELLVADAANLRRGHGVALFLNLRSALSERFHLINPALHTDDAVGGVGAGHAEINVGAQSLQRQAALEIPFFAGDFRAV